MCLRRAVIKRFNMPNLIIFIRDSHHSSPRQDGMPLGAKAHSTGRA